MKREELLIERLKKYGESDMYPFHMPGHKRSSQGVLGKFPDPYSIDITEIEGFDNLNHPEGILKKSMEFAAEVYGADKTYYLINGSSGGILSAVSGVISSNEKIIVGRNCHKSVYHGSILKKSKTIYIYPQILNKLWISGGISEKDVEKVLEENPDAKAVLVVSPTYEGIVSDIQKIAAIVHRKDIPLIVDEAHGAHFSFGGSLFPMSALDCGADIVIQSLHKTLPSFTQTAVLHVKSKYVDIERLEWYLQVYQSSSPSYVLMSGIESCIFEMYKNGDKYFAEFIPKLRALRKRFAEMKCLRILDDSVKGSYGVYDLDQSKIVISCKGLSITGVDLARILREKYNLEMEMCGVNYVVAITTFLDMNEGLDRLKRALLEIDKELYKREEGKNYEVDENIYKYLGQDWKEDDNWWAEKQPEIVTTLADAMERDFQTLEISKSTGYVSAEFVYLYPPGIPIVAPGERINRDISEKICWYKKMGLPVQGMADKKADYLRVFAY